MPCWLRTWKSRAVGAKRIASDCFPNATVRIVVDLALRSRRNMTTGANVDDFHIRGVDVGRDIKVDQWADLRTVNSGENCPQCEKGTLEVSKSLEIGHIFKLGTKYSDSMWRLWLTQEEAGPMSWHYGIGLTHYASAIDSIMIVMAHLAEIDCPF